MPSVRCACGLDLNYQPEHGGNSARCRCGRVVALPSIAVAKSESRPVSGATRPQPAPSSPAHSRRRIPVAALSFVFVVALFGILLWPRKPSVSEIASAAGNPAPLAQQGETPPQRSSRLTSVASNDPFADLAVTRAAAPDRDPGACAPADSNESWRPVPNGYEPADPSETGLGSLTVRNGSDADAVVMLIPTGTTDVARQMFVRRRRSAKLDHVAPRKYVVAFEKGTTYLSSGRFCHSHGEYEFDRPLNFTEVESANRTDYHDFEVTLYTVPYGNAKSHPTGPHARLRIRDTSGTGQPAEPR